MDTIGPPDDGGEEGVCALVLAGVDAPEGFEAAKEAIDAVALLADDRIVGAIGSRGRGAPVMARRSRAPDRSWTWPGRKSGNQGQAFGRSKGGMTTKILAPSDADMSKWRHSAESVFCKLRKFKHIAMRACKTDQSLAAMIRLAAAVIASR